jgi:hypothetical protein
MKRDNYHAVLGEEIREQNKRILEILDTLVPLPNKVSNIEIQLEQVKQDITVIKAVITAQETETKKIKHYLRIAAS